MAEIKKRETAYKVRVSELLRANPVYDEAPNEPGQEIIQKRLLFVELGNQKYRRVNILANVIEKYQSDNESRFASLTIDDGSGQIKIRVFGDETEKISQVGQGDTVIVIGILRSYNNEIYIIPEIIRKQDPRYLLVRKLEIEKNYIKDEVPRQEIKVLRDQVIEKIKHAESHEGIETEDLILTLNVQGNLVSQEIKKLLEEGIIYEPRPGRLRYLG